MSKICGKLANALAHIFFIFDDNMVKNNQAYLDRLQQVLTDSDYTIRFERGTFQSGWCLLDQKRIVVLNKFLDTEGRINTLLDLLPQIQIHFDKLTLESQKLYMQVMQAENEKLPQV